MQLILKQTTIVGQSVAFASHATPHVKKFIDFHGGKICTGNGWKGYLTRRYIKNFQDPPRVRKSFLYAPFILILLEVERLAQKQVQHTYFLIMYSCWLWTIVRGRFTNTGQFCVCFLNKSIAFFVNKRDTEKILLKTFITQRVTEV